MKGMEAATVCYEEITATDAAVCGEESKRVWPFNNTNNALL
jgi:hypothetical protein